MTDQELDEKIRSCGQQIRDLEYDLRGLIAAREERRIARMDELIRRWSYYSSSEKAR